MTLFIGLMSGTSMDAVDAALVDFDDQSHRLIHYYQHPIPQSLKEELEATQLSGGDISTRAFGLLHRRVGLLFAEATKQLLIMSGTSITRVAAIGSHGQTLLHSPVTDPCFTLQLGDPSTIAAKTGIPTVADFRSMDMVLGGQGAPLAPAFHNAVFRSSKENRVVLNIGGISNITHLPQRADAPVIGFDTGPGNTLLDAWCQDHGHGAYDKDGLWATSGKPDQALLDQLLDEPYFARAFPKSTGRDLFNLDWLGELAGDRLGKLSAEDVQATLLSLSVESIALHIDRIEPRPATVLVCGGGAYNPAMMQALQRRLEDCVIDTTATEGLSPDCIEAVCFAWLAMRRMHLLPGNIPSVTGAERSACLGGVYRP